MQRNSYRSVNGNCRNTGKHCLFLAHSALVSRRIQFCAHKPARCRCSALYDLYARSGARMVGRSVGAKIRFGERVGEGASRPELKTTVPRFFVPGTVSVVTDAELCTSKRSLLSAHPMSQCFTVSQSASFARMSSWWPQIDNEGGRARTPLMITVFLVLTISTVPVVSPSLTLCVIAFLWGVNAAHARKRRHYVILYGFCHLVKTWRCVLISLLERVQDHRGVPCNLSKKLLRSSSVIAHWIQTSTARGLRE
jgi:hypothetical protein